MDVPDWTDAELDAANNPLFARSAPRQPRKRNLDTHHASIDQRIADAIANHQSYMDSVLAGVISELQHRFEQKLQTLQIEVASLRNELEVEKRVNLRMAQVEQRHYNTEHHVNGYKPS
jgi:hypothetical protein